MFPIGLKTCQVLWPHSVISVVLKVDCKVLFALSRAGGIKQSRPQAKWETWEIETGTRWQMRKPENT